jgi:hypothetical protein
MMIALCVVANPAAIATRAGGNRSTEASASRTMAATDEAHLVPIESSGSLLVEEGPAAGTLPGKVKVRFDVGPIVLAYFTITTSHGHGVVRGRGSGRLRSAGAYSTFGGTLRISSGTGRYSHVRGSGGLYGAINRRTEAMTVQTTGTIAY